MTSEEQIAQLTRERDNLQKEVAELKRDLERAEKDRAELLARLSFFRSLGICPYLIPKTVWTTSGGNVKGIYD